MLDGTAIKGDFILIANEANPDTQQVSVPSSSFQTCCSDFSLKVLAQDLGEEEEADPLKNDISGFLWWFEKFITDATLKLYKWNNGTYEEVADLNDGTYGSYYAYKFFTNKEGEQFIGYQLNWRLVLDEFGSGSYKVGVTATPAYGSPFTKYSRDYRLNVYTDYRANGTLRIEYYLNGVNGLDDDTKVRDFGTLNWYNSYRINGWFGYPKASKKEDRILYNTGQRVYVEESQEPVYTLKTMPIPHFLHEIFRIEIYMADKILITTYDNLNPSTYIQKDVFFDEDYAPNWNIQQNPLASIELKCKQTYNRLRKLRY